MKKIVTIVVLILIVVGFGYFLFSISPEPVNKGNDNINLGDIPKISKPREVGVGDHILGKLEAKNTLIAYEDLECPACAQFEPTLKSLPSVLNDTRLIFRHFPLATIHKNALISAFSAEAAGLQGKFWEYTGLLYKKQSDWSEEVNPISKFVEIAGEAGVLDLKKFRVDTESAINQQKIKADLKEAMGLGLRGTPSLVFNGNQLQLGSADQIKQQAERFYIK